MAGYPSTGTLFDKGGADLAEKGTTRTSLSTQIIVYVADQPVGAIQSFQESQSRTNKKIQEVGTDGFIEIVPQTAATVTLTVNRMVFDGLSLPEAMSRGFRNLHAQRIPFDIKVFDKFASSDEPIITVYHNCWFSQLGKQYQSSDYTIQENASIDVEFVTTTRAGQPVANTQTGNAREMIPEVDNQGIEQAVDIGQDGRRGGMDFPELINAAYL